MTPAVGTSAPSLQFRGVTGALELALDEAWRSATSVPVRVTASLAAALDADTLSGEPVETVRGLSVGERQRLALASNSFGSRR